MQVLPLHIIHQLSICSHPATSLQISFLIDIHYIDLTSLFIFLRQFLQLIIDTAMVYPDRLIAMWRKQVCVLSNNSIRVVPLMMMILSRKQRRILSQYPLQGQEFSSRRMRSFVRHICIVATCINDLSDEDLPYELEQLTWRRIEAHEYANDRQ